MINQYLLFLFFILLPLSMLLTKVLVSYSERNNIKSQVNERSSHSESVSNGGGLGFMIIIIASIYVLSINQFFNVNNIYFFLLASFSIGIMGYLDDLFDISALIRFIVQLILTTIVIVKFSGFPLIIIFQDPSLNFIISLSISVIFLVWIINLFNFMDGIDGIASFQGLFIISSYMILVSLNQSDMTSNNMLFFLYSCTIFFASLLGFLFFNFPTASIFMGDSGSSFLGFFTGILGVFALLNEWISFWTLLILWSVFLVDATVTLLVRIYNKEKWYQAHRSHAYQKLTIIFSEKLDSRFEKSIARTKSHRRVCSIYFLINLIWVLPLSFLSIKYYQYGFIITLVCFCPLIISSIIIGAGKRD